jgi:hypothetical protein
MEVAMTNRPHDVVDLYLAPVALALDARIAELAELTPEELGYRAAVEANTSNWTPEMRDDGLLRAVTYLIELHGWQVSWHERGIKVSHEKHELVLGVPDSFSVYRRGPITGAASGASGRGMPSDASTE